MASEGGIFEVGDTIHMRNPSRSAPYTVLPSSQTRCELDLLRPPAAPPAIPEPPMPPVPPHEPPAPPESPPLPIAPPPPISDVFCPTVGYELVYDSGNGGDKCVDSQEPSNWIAPVGCQDSLNVIPTLNGKDRAPRVLLAACSESPGHTSSWGGKVEMCKVDTVEGDVGYHNPFILYNDRGDEMRVARCGHWGHQQMWIFCQLLSPSDTLNSIFGVGDTLHVKNDPADYTSTGGRPFPPSVQAGTHNACDISQNPPSRM